MGIDYSKINVYDDIVSAKLIQPYKPVYGKVDFLRLVKKGVPENVAQFALLCSAAHYTMHDKKQSRLTRTINRPII